MGNEKGAVVAEVSGEAQNQKADSGEGAEESESNNGEGAGDASKEEDEAKIEDESSEFYPVGTKEAVSEMTEEMWGEDHDLLVNEFMSHPTARGMICYVDGQGQLVMSWSITENKLPKSSSTLSASQPPSAFCL